MNSIHCPHCNGKGYSEGFINAVSGHRLGSLDCQTCHATGEITEQQAQRIEIGRRINAYRLSTKPRQTLREVAKSWGISVGEYCQIERLGTAESEAGNRALCMMILELE